jgi:hypothetical protein
MSEESEGVIRWENPPPKRTNESRGRKHDAVVAALKSRPGVSALVFVGVFRSLSASLKARGCTDVVSRNFRKVKGKLVCDIYATWPASVTVTDGL